MGNCAGRRIETLAKKGAKCGKLGDGVWEDVERNPMARAETKRLVISGVGEGLGVSLLVRVKFWGWTQMLGGWGGEKRYITLGGRRVDSKWGGGFSRKKC